MVYIKNTNKHWKISIEVEQKFETQYFIKILKYNVLVAYDKINIERLFNNLVVDGKVENKIFLTGKYVTVMRKCLTGKLQTAKSFRVQTNFTMQFL